jgi:septal ring factor EnvC (AmiA/AmiB activator)
MYENEISRLEHIKVWGEVETPGDADAIAVAIALLRAAAPRDEAEEREHCRKTIDAMFPNLLSGWDSVERLLMRERAAARAEEHTARYELLASDYIGLKADHTAAMCRVTQLEAQLDALQAHINRLEGQLDSAAANASDLADEVNDLNSLICCCEWGTGSGQHGDTCRVTQLESQLAALRETFDPEASKP